MGVKWNFPNNGGGQIRGISDAGIETFAGNEMRALAREICQNSLDALCSDKIGPVYVEFQKYIIDIDKVPGYDEYKQVVRKAYDYWNLTNSEKAVEFLSDARHSLNKNKTSVMRISDFNTTGLSSPFEDNDGGWNSLVKIDGGATKTGAQAGAFGIGKNAPFCNSRYRLVFYRTLNLDGERAAQGVSRLVSFPENLSDTRNTLTTGIGYYGESEGNIPVTSILELDDLYERNEIGTDVFIYGFTGDTRWGEYVVHEILDNFLMSIYRNQLAVNVGTTVIEKRTLDSCMEQRKYDMEHAYSYYQVLKNKNTKVFTRGFHGLGTLKLSVLVDSKLKLNKKILITRNSGMKLFEQKNISSMISFSAILEMEGDLLNKFFRELETPAHDRWDPGRYTKNKKLAKDYINELKKWMKTQIINLGEEVIEDEVEVEGLTGILQKDDGKFASHNDFTGILPKESKEPPQETLQDKVDEIVLQPRESAMPIPKGIFFGSEGQGKSHTRDVSGKIGNKGDSATRTLKGTRHRKKREAHRGLPHSEGEDIVHERYGGEINQPLEKVRIMKLGQGCYRASFVVPYDVAIGHIEIVTVGENGKSNRLNIKAAKAISGCEQLKINNKGIMIKSLKANKKIVLEFFLSVQYDYAMGVNLYEHH